jgi:hypothetical protein
MRARKGVAAMFVALSTAAAGVACGSVEVASGTASVAILSGSARDLSASGSGASRLALEGLSAGSLDVTLSGPS